MGQLEVIMYHTAEALGAMPTSGRPNNMAVSLAIITAGCAELADYNDKYKSPRNTVKKDFLAMHSTLNI